MFLFSQNSSLNVIFYICFVLIHVKVLVECYFLLFIILLIKNMNTFNQFILLVTSHFVKKVIISLLNTCKHNMTRAFFTLEINSKLILNSSSGYELRWSRDQIYILLQIFNIQFCSTFVNRGTYFTCTTFFYNTVSYLLVFSSSLALEYLCNYPQY